MTKIYHFDPNNTDFIFMDKPPCDKPDGGHSLQERMRHVLNTGVKTIYEAKQIWFYTDGIFESYKLNSFDREPCHLRKLLESHGINVYKVPHPKINNHTYNYCFATSKDEFLFKLKLG